MEQKQPEKRKRRKQYVLVGGMLLLLLYVGCATPTPSPTPTLDTEATKVAMARALEATMTALAPTVSNTPLSPDTPTPTDTPTRIPLTSTPSPTPTIAPTQPMTYVVQAGDTMGRLARRFSTTIQDIAQANNITNVHLIEVGQVLVLPENAKTPDASIPTRTQLPTVKPSPTPAAAASAITKDTAQAPIPATSSVSPGMAGSASRLECVVLDSVLDFDRAVVVRKNGEVWILEKGIGCLSLDSYEGRSILVYSPGLFAGVGSSVILPDRSQQCRIWNSEHVGETTGGPAEAKYVGPAVVSSRIKGKFTGWHGDTVFVLSNGQIWQQASYAYWYHYAYWPEVVIVQTSGGYKMVVEGVRGSIYVRRLK